ncbi:uncharacterized protein LOC106662106 isoform X2 [Cimex lectularius]|uniref:Uncharacterized protein n=1 Tax=Cimex lectularius TaxID=79782 RepID=A0A8I6RA45_CIMLE|nr:uncharacterized protein LOC106662106 isoform X2 [Cimex lectularius]
MVLLGEMHPQLHRHHRLKQLSIPRAVLIEGVETNVNIQISSDNLEPTLKPGSSLEKSDKSRTKSLARRLLQSSTSDVIEDQPYERASLLLLPSMESLELIPKDLRIGRHIFASFAIKKLSIYPGTCK